MGGEVLGEGLGGDEGGEPTIQLPGPRTIWRWGREIGNRVSLAVLELQAALDLREEIIKLSNFFLLGFSLNEKVETEILQLDIT